MLMECAFDTGSIVLNYAEGPPSGPPLVVLHGGSGSWRYWHDLITALAARWHVYAPDLRGHGDSGHVPGSYLLTDYVADMATFLARIVGPPAVLFGHSLGGEIAVMLAACYPALVRALIVGDAPLSRDYHRTGEDPAHRQMNVLWHALAASEQSVDEIAAALREMPIRAEDGTMRRAALLFGADNPWFRFQAENLHRLDPDVLAAVLDDSLRMLDGYDPDTLLPRIVCPVLLIQAAHGGALSDVDVTRARSLLRNVMHVRLAGADHSLGTERVLAATADFLRRVTEEQESGTGTPP